MAYREPRDFFDTASPSKKAQSRHDRRQERTHRSTEKTREPLKALNEAQADLIEALQESAQVFAIGPAGTGKTYIAARHAMMLLLAGAKERIVISRATVSKSKHKLGFRPGNQDEKIQDWMIPIMDGFKAEVSTATIDKLRKDGKIEFAAFETMRGRSFAGSVAILDEAQNCDLGDLRMFLTRIGESTQVIICGDLDQVDIPDSGFAAVLELIEKHNLSAEIVEFGPEDVVRSAIAKEWVLAFSEP